MFLPGQHSACTAQPSPLRISRQLLGILNQLISARLSQDAWQIPGFISQRGIYKYNLRRWWMPPMSRICAEWLGHYLVAISFNTWTQRRLWMHVSPRKFLSRWQGFLCPYPRDLFTLREAGRLNRRAVKPFMRYAVRLGAARNSGSLSNQWVACWALI